MQLYKAEWLSLKSLSDSEAFVEGKRGIWQLNL